MDHFFSFRNLPLQHPPQTRLHRTLHPSHQNHKPSTRPPASKRQHYFSFTSSGQDARFIPAYPFCPRLGVGCVFCTSASRRSATGGTHRCGTRRWMYKWAWGPVCIAERIGRGCTEEKTARRCRVGCNFHCTILVRTLHAHLGPVACGGGGHGFGWMSGYRPCLGFACLSEGFSSRCMERLPESLVSSYFTINHQHTNYITVPERGSVSSDIASVVGIPAVATHRHRVTYSALRPVTAASPFRRRSTP